MCVCDQCEKWGFTLVWRIENFRFNALGQGSYLESSPFHVKTNSVTWYLSFFSYRHENYIHCYLGKVGERKVSVDYEICYCTTSGERLCATKSENNLEMKNDTNSERGKIDGHLVDRLPQNTLVIHCHLRKIEPANPETPMHYYARTRIGLHRKTFVWNIEKFSTLLLKKEAEFILESVQPDEPTITFQLALAGSTVEDASVQIFIHSSKTTMTFFTCRMTVVDKDAGSPMKLMYDEHLFEYSSAPQMRVLPHFLTRRELLREKNSYLPDDVLSLKCEVTFSGNVRSGIEEVVYGPTTAVPKPQPKESNTLRGDLRNLWESGSLSDFQLSAGAGTFPVHRLILSARSPVFKAMFENDMLERSEHSLTLPDLDADTVEKMLLYVYTDSVPDMQWQDVSKLYFAADKYQLWPLRELCSSRLSRMLDVENAAEVLALSDRHRDPELKGAVRDFVLKSGKAVLDADGWKLLEQENAPLALETLRHIFCEKVHAP